MNAVIGFIMSVVMGFSTFVVPAEHKTTYTTFYNDHVYVLEERTWDFTGGSIEKRYEMTYDEWTNR